MIDIAFISQQVKHQFPEFYLEQGDNFVAFLQAYYEWMEQTNQIIGQSRKLPDNRDIDTTTNQFLEHFKEKYMSELPLEIIGNQRLFQKHILELYRSKGSISGLKLLFRLLYNEDVDVYVPSYDIFKTSDGVWKEPHYFETTDAESFWKFQGQVVKGGISGAQAIVESLQRDSVGDSQVFVIYLSNITGTFKVGEPLICEGVGVIEAPRIIGSPETFEIESSSAGFSAGDLLIDVVDRQKPLYGVVKQTYDSVGIIEFTIVDGGDYYSLGANVEITAGSNTTGFGANFEVYSISNTSIFTSTTDMILPYANVAINANTYGFPSNPSGNSSTIIEDALNIFNIEVGTIESIATTNPGTGYDGDVTVKVVDPYTSTRGIWVGDGFGGNNAVITGTSLTGTGLIGEIRVYDSGLRYNANTRHITMKKIGDPSKSALVNANLGPIGKSVGYYDDTKGFTSEDKYLYDGHYYQDYSYVIKSSHSIEYYIDILKKTVHSAGNAVYGITNLNANVNYMGINSATVTQLN